jgi:hypothetical protein
MWNKKYSGTDILEGAADAIRRRLPSTWVLDELYPSAPDHPDAIFRLRAPDGDSSTFVVESKSRLDPRDVPRVISQLYEYKENPQFDNPALLVVARYLSPRTQALLDAAGVAYADSTGNLRLALEQPAVLIDRAGAVANPWRDDRPLRSLKGPTAGRVVRAVCDFNPPYGIRELAERSQTPAASVSRVVEVLDREAIVTKDSRSRVITVDWAALIRRWTQDYSLMSSNRTGTYLEPRGLPQLLSKLKTSGLQYAVTGSLAGAAKAPIAGPRLATLYVENRDSAAAVLGLRPAESGANVLLAEPFDSVVFDRVWTQDNVRFSALSQVAADLLTSPGRGPAEGEELIKWMEAHEREWRHV